MFKQDYTCPASTFVGHRLCFRVLSPAILDFPDCFTKLVRLIPSGLFRVRSPLLTESRLISIPLGTEMFQFPRFAPTPYVFRC